MAGLSLNFLVTGDEAVALELRGLGFRSANVEPAFAVLEQEYERTHESWFDSRGSGTWPPLMDSTKKRKRREGLTSQPLFGKTTDLFSSLTEHTSDSVRYMTKDTFVFGTTVPYARFHRYGTAKMVERNPLARTIALEAEAHKTLSDYLVGPLGKRQMRQFGARKAGWWR